MLLESLRKLLNIRKTVCSAMIDIASSSLNTDFRKNGRNVERLGVRITTELLGIPLKV